LPLAAVLAEESEKLPHLIGPQCVSDGSPFALSFDQSGPRKFLQMEGQGGRRDREGLGNLPGGEALLSFSDEEPED